MGLPVAGVKAMYLPFAADADLVNAQVWQDSALGAICFCESSDNSALDFAEIPTLQLQAPILDGADFATEIWLSAAALNLQQPLNNGHLNSGHLDNGHCGAIQYRFNSELLFGVITLQDSNHESNSLQAATESAYRQIFALMETLDYPHVYRFWNYMTDINGLSSDENGVLERYRQFNVGRKDAFLAYENGLGDQLPAACALGLASGPLTIAFLLGRVAPIAIQNPRQINAFEYPDAYGPRTPSFSRATLLPAEQNPLLFISGTASIVGHLTLHIDDVIAQTKETLVNLEAVITEANRVLGKPVFNLRDIYFRVYIRRASDLSAVRSEMQRYLGGTVKALFVQADICRQALLLEIEATTGPNLAVSGVESI